MDQPLSPLCVYAGYTSRILRCLKMVLPQARAEASESPPVASLRWAWSSASQCSHFLPSCHGIIAYQS
jgi:hypothetical protein